MSKSASSLNSQFLEALETCQASNAGNSDDIKVAKIFALVEEYKARMQEEKERAKRTLRLEVEEKDSKYRLFFSTAIQPIFEETFPRKKYPGLEYMLEELHLIKVASY